MPYQDGTDLAPSKIRTAPPPMYKVVLLNDDFTPMDFVVIVLERFFYMGREQATQVMLKIHTEGRGICGTFTRDVAATKGVLGDFVAQVRYQPRHFDGVVLEIGTFGVELAFDNGHTRFLFLATRGWVNQAAAG